MNERPLLMIPGPIELSPAVVAAAAAPPPSHLSPSFVEEYAQALRRTRQVFLASADSQPFIVAGGGTIAMESVAQNLIEPNEPVLVVDTGYFSERMTEMLRRRGARVTSVGAEPGAAPSIADVQRELEAGHTAHRKYKAVFATHVDTSTGVRVDAQPLAELARTFGALSVFDGVCATAGETFEMAYYDADVYLTASQKALGAPPGLAVWVASPRAIEARARLVTPPALALDWQSWQPIMQGYENGAPRYFSTPATSLVRALNVALGELLTADEASADAMATRFAEHARAARAIRAALEAFGLRLVPQSTELAANTLTAAYYPDGVDVALLARMREHGVIIAGGLHRAIATRSFRIGHMGLSTRRLDDVLRTVKALGAALADCGAHVDTDEALHETRRILATPLRQFN